MTDSIIKKCPVCLSYFWEKEGHYLKNSITSATSRLCCSSECLSVLKNAKKIILSEKVDRDENAIHIYTSGRNVKPEDIFTYIAPVLSKCAKDFNRNYLKAKTLERQKELLLPVYSLFLLLRDKLSILHQYDVSKEIMTVDFSSFEATRDKIYENIRLAQHFKKQWLILDSLISKEEPTSKDMFAIVLELEHALRTMGCILTPYTSVLFPNSSHPLFLLFRTLEADYLRDIKSLYSMCNHMEQEIFEPLNKGGGHRSFPHTMNDLQKKFILFYTKVYSTTGVGEPLNDYDFSLPSRGYESFKKMTYELEKILYEFIDSWEALYLLRLEQSIMAKYHSEEFLDNIQKNILELQRINLLIILNDVESYEQLLLIRRVESAVKKSINLQNQQSNSAGCLFTFLLFIGCGILWMGLGFDDSDPLFWIGMIGFTLLGALGKDLVAPLISLTLKRMKPTTPYKKSFNDLFYAELEKRNGTLTGTSRIYSKSLSDDLDMNHFKSNMVGAKFALEQFLIYKDAILACSDAMSYRSNAFVSGLLFLGAGVSSLMLFYFENIFARSQFHYGQILFCAFAVLGVVSFAFWLYKGIQYGKSITEKYPDILSKTISLLSFTDFLRRKYADSTYLAEIGNKLRNRHAYLERKLYELEKSKAGNESLEFEDFTTINELEQEVEKKKIVIEKSSVDERNLANINLFKTTGLASLVLIFSFFGMAYNSDVVHERELEEIRQEKAAQKEKEELELKRQEEERERLEEEERERLEEEERKRLEEEERKRVEADKKIAELKEKFHPNKAVGSAPESYEVLFETTQGDFVVEVQRAWAPLGADRFYNLVKIGYFNNVAFFRSIKGYIVQFGIHGNPIVSQMWKDTQIQDDPVIRSNTRGYVTFAFAGENSRMTQVFINLGDNNYLDATGFAPFGKISTTKGRGMNIVDNIFTDYSNDPSQKQIQEKGNSYLKNNYPKLDYILSTRFCNNDCIAQKQAKVDQQEVFVVYGTSGDSEPWLNVRDQASSDSRIIGKVYDGTKVQLIRREGKWLYCDILTGERKGTKGWLHQKWLKIQRGSHSNSEISEIWSKRRTSSVLDLGIGEDEGPFWTISVSAYSKRSQAEKEAKKLRRKGWLSHIANLENYGSAKNRSFWFVFIGPYAYDSKTKVKEELQRVKDEITKKAYAVTLGKKGERETIK